MSADPEIDWRQLSACGGSPSPDLWFPHTDTGGAARKAIAICQGCEVRKRCGANAQAKGLRDGIYGGFHTKYAKGWNGLHEFLGLPKPEPDSHPDTAERVEVTCACGTVFTQSKIGIAKRCIACRNDLVPAGPTRARVQEVLDRVKTRRAAANELGISKEQVKRILTVHEFVKRETAAKILGREIARAS